MNAPRFRSAGALALLLFGCGAAKVPEPALCAVVLPSALERTQPDALPPPAWFQLLFKDYRSGLPEDPVDCAGEPIAWSPLPAGCSDTEPAAQELLPRRPLGPESLIVRHAEGDYWFGWAAYRRFDNGMAEGPLAIARLAGGKLEARALGNLRAYPIRARLSVRRLNGQHVLVAEGEACSAAGGCTRATRLAWLDRQRFRARPLRSATQRNCLGPSWFPQRERIERPLGPRWARVLQRTLSLAFESGQITVDEQVTVQDRDLEQPALPPRLFRQAEAKLRIVAEGGEFLSEGQSLWSAIRMQDGSTEWPRSTPAPR